MSTTKVPSRGRRYPAQVMCRARELRAGGWSCDRICQLLKEEYGVEPSYATVVVWTSEEQRLKHLDRSRRKQHEVRMNTLSGRLGSDHHSPGFRLLRMRALRDVGVSFSGIAKAMGLDYGDELTEDQVRHALEKGRYPKRLGQGGARGA